MKSSQLHMVVHKNGEAVYREPTAYDGVAIYELIKNSQNLDLNSSYSYLMWSKYFNKTSIVAEVRGHIVAFVSGFIQPNSPDTLFIWQVIVAESQKGNGVATTLIKKLLARHVCRKVTYLEATISPSNLPSQQLFKRLAEKLKAPYEVSECFSEDMFPDRDHEAEMIYRIGPIDKSLNDE